MGKSKLFDNQNKRLEYKKRTTKFKACLLIRCMVYVMKPFGCTTEVHVSPHLTHRYELRNKNKNFRNSNGSTDVGDKY